MDRTTPKFERKTFMETLRKYSVIFTAAFIVIIAFILTKGTFLSANNLLNVGERSAAIGIVALGQMLVILTGGIDLSVSGIIGIGFCTVSLLSDKITNIPILFVIILTLFITAGFGSINGLLVSRTRIPPFILTLGTYLTFQSLALVLSGAANLSFVNYAQWVKNVTKMSELAGRLSSTILWILVSCIIMYILSFSKFGKNIYATGANELAANMSGIKSKNIKLAVYTLSGLMSGIASLLIMYKLVNCNPASTVSYQIDSIAAVIVGGTSLNGGEGSVYGTFVGAFIMATLVNLMNLVSLDVYSQNIVKGIVLITFVFISQYLSNAKVNSKG